MVNYSHPVYRRQLLLLAQPRQDGLWLGCTHDRIVGDHIYIYYALTQPGDHRQRNRTRKEIKVGNASPA